MGHSWTGPVIGQGSLNAEMNGLERTAAIRQDLTPSTVGCCHMDGTRAELLVPDRRRRPVWDTGLVEVETRGILLDGPHTPVQHAAGVRRLRLAVMN